jgi:hypothetical protein
LTSGDLIAVNDLGKSMDMAVVTESYMISNVGIPGSYPYCLQTIQDIIEVGLFNE